MFAYPVFVKHCYYAGRLAWESNAKKTLASLYLILFVKPPRNPYLDYVVSNLPYNYPDAYAIAIGRQHKRVKRVPAFAGRQALRIAARTL
jgi:hypothetical protein